MPDPELREIFDANLFKIATPDSRVGHSWYRSATALIGKKQWEDLVATLVQPEIHEYYTRYDNRYEFSNWIDSNLNPDQPPTNPEDRTLSIAAQLFALKNSPRGKVGIITGSSEFTKRFLTESKVTQNQIVAISRSGLEQLPDKGLAAIVLDWTLSRTLNPHELFRLINQKLQPGGFYVHTDRKPFQEMMNHSEYFDDGFAVVLEERELLVDGVVKKFIIPKIFVEDLPKELRRVGLNILYNTRDNPESIYDIAVATKPPTSLSPIQTTQMAEDVWSYLIAAKESLKPVFTKPIAT